MAEKRESIAREKEKKAETKLRKATEQQSRLKTKEQEIQELLVSAESRKVEASKEVKVLKEQTQLATVARK